MDSLVIIMARSLSLHKANMAHKHVEILSDQLDSSSDDSQYNIESDDNDVANKASLNEAELDKILYKMNKKVIQDLKRKFMSGSTYVHQKTKHQKRKIDSYGFGSLLLFDSNYVPNKFTSWIANKVDVSTSEIILRDKIIPITKQSVHAVLDLPIGGLEFGRDFDKGKQFILSKFGLVSIPSVKFFGDQFIQKKIMSDEDVIISFLIVALACFLCPNSSLMPSTKYLTIFEDVDSLRCYDWSKFVYDWLMLSIKKFQKRNSLGGCLYFWAVMYLDCVDFGERYIDQAIPRISIWKKGMITTFSDLDKIDENNFGLRPVKDLSTTCYFKVGVMHIHSPIQFHFDKNFESAIGNMLPDYIKDNICDLLVSYCSTNHISDSQPFEDVVISVLLMISQSAIMDFVQVENEAVGSLGFDNQGDHDSAVRNADLYGSVANVDHQNISLNNVTIHDNATTVCTASFVSAAAINVVKIVANKFKSRLSQFNNRDSTDHIFDESRPRFKLFDSDDESSNSRKENEEFGANSASQNSPDVVFLGESKFPEQCKKLCVKTEVLYNSTNNMSIGSREFSSSGGKLPPHGPRRIIIPGRHACNPYVPQRPRFVVSDEENRYFVAICRLADSTKWQSYDAVDIDNVKVKFYSFGHSMKRGGFISPYVMSAFCRIMFHNNHPSKSKKNYFFPSIGELLISKPIIDENISDFEKVKKSFDGAATARKLHLCDMLFFPIHYNQHWFLFIVDIKDRLFVFLDPLHSEGDDYFEPILSLLLKNFQTVWGKFVGTMIDFSTFTINGDSGVYVMKFIELWSPRIVLQNEFSKENIQHIRVQFLSMNIVFYPMAENSCET
uniref:Ubiquitin-like protease family profile domain-containing protein n=1 Tax=Oryza punctata TaxID=4537 RepID=A0A0E0L9G7_ORYPU